MVHYNFFFVFTCAKYIDEFGIGAKSVPGARHPFRYRGNGDFLIVQLLQKDLPFQTCASFNQVGAIVVQCLVGAILKKSEFRADSCGNGTYEFDGFQCQKTQLERSCILLIIHQPLYTLRLLRTQGTEDGMQKAKLKVDVETAL